MAQEFRADGPWKRFRKRPVVVEVFGPVQEDFVVHALGGDVLAVVGDYVVRGVKGELYPCKPDIFEKTYESAEG